MIDTYFLSQRIELLKDITITMEMFFPYYPFLEEEEPPSAPQIELVVFGIWLRIDRPISQFSPESYLQEIEQRLMRLSKLGWKAFNETTGKPDGVSIGSVRGHPVGSQILAYLKSVVDNDSDISTEELHRAMQSRKLQKEICAWLNEQELQRITSRISELEDELDHPFGIGRCKFNIACQSIFKNWFLGKGISVLKSDKTETSTEFVEPKKGKPRRICEYPHLRDHINTVFPDLIRKLLGEDILPVDEIFPEGVTVTDDEKEYLINVFKQRLWKHDKYKQYKKENKRLNEVSTTEGGKCFTIVEDRPPSEDGLKEISPVK